MNPTDDHNGKVLATYPLKASFITECLNPNNSWEKRHLAERVVSILDHVYEEGKAETLTHPFVKDEPIFTREDKSYKESKRILNELVKYSKSHDRSVAKNCILMCVILTSLLVQAMLKSLVYPLIFGPSASSLQSGFNIEFLYSLCLVALISVTTCFDVPCCWRFRNKKAKFSMFRNLHIFRLVLLLLYLVIMTVYTGFTIYCVLSRICAQYPLFIFINSMVHLTIVLFVLLYVLIMLVVINVKCCCYKNSFRPIRSCRNLAHEIIMIDIFDDSNNISA